MLKEFAQGRCLRKNASGVPTGIVPLRRVASAAVIIDVEDTGFDDCKNSVLSYFRGKGIKADVFFLDFRRLAKGERLITPISTTILRRNLNWYGKPSRASAKTLLSLEPDLLVCLVPERTFTAEYLASATRARFKAGRFQSPVFDMVYRADGVSQDFAFLEICKLLEKIS